MTGEGLLSREAWEKNEKAAGFATDPTASSIVTLDRHNNRAFQMMKLEPGYGVWVGSSDAMLL